MKGFKYIYRKLTSQKILFYLFLCVLILPNVILFFTESVPLLAKITNVILPLGIYWLILSFSKKPGKPFWALFLFIFLGAFQIVLLYLFGEAIITVDMLLNLVNTNSSEVFELLHNLLPGMMFVLIVYIPSLVYAAKSIRRKNRLNLLFLKRQRIIALLITGAGVVLLTLSYTLLRPEYHYEIQDDVFPINVCYNAVLAIERECQVDNYYKTSKEFQFNATSTRATEEKEVYIFVIGETSRAFNWSLYGYDRPTNPKLEQTENLMAFPYALTESNTTHKSVPLLLSAASAQNYSAVYKQKSIITAFKEARFETFYCTNQRENYSYIDFYANEADETVRLTTGLPPSVNILDMELITKVKERLAKGYNKLFIVLHTYGSHFEYFSRYPEEETFFLPDKETSASPKNRTSLLNAYDNTIHYVDKFLSKLIQTLDSENIPTALLYTSDHGEDIFDDERKLFLHASPVPSYYQLHVPFLIWMSPQYKEQHYDVYTTIEENRKQLVPTNSVAFHTLLSLAGITTPYFEPNYSLGAENYQVENYYYLNDHCEPEEYDEIGLKELDFQMFEKMNIPLCSDNDTSN